MFLNRAERDLLPAQAYQTYHILAPAQTHFRPSSCAEAGCLARHNGWRTTVDERTPLGQRQAHYIRGDRSRRHVETRMESGLTEFVFEAGQECFTAHQVPLERPELYVVRDGDHRGNPTGWSQQHSADGWVNAFAEHQDRIARAVNG